jgi:hypothetical protein
LIGIVGDGFPAAGNLVLASSTEWWWFGAGIPGEFPAFGKTI